MLLVLNSNNAEGLFLNKGRIWLAKPERFSKARESQSYPEKKVIFSLLCSFIKLLILISKSS